MSTTVVRQRTTRFPGKGIGMALAGLAIAAAVGYGIANIDNSPQESVASTSVGSADQAFLNRGAELASERQSLLNEATKGVELATPAIGAVVVPEIEFGGMFAPSWQPDWSAVETVRPDRHWFGQTPPTAYTDQGLDAYLGSEPVSGPR